MKPDTQPDDALDENINTVVSLAASARAVQDAQAAVAVAKAAGAVRYMVLGHREAALAIALADHNALVDTVKETTD